MDSRVFVVLGSALWRISSFQSLNAERECSKRSAVEVSFNEIAPYSSHLKRVQRYWRGYRDFLRWCSRLSDLERDFEPGLCSAHLVNKLKHKRVLGPEFTGFENNTQGKRKWQGRGKIRKRRLRDTRAKQVKKVLADSCRVADQCAFDAQLAELPRRGLWLTFSNHGRALRLGKPKTSGATRVNRDD